MPSGNVTLFLGLRRLTSAGITRSRSTCRSRPPRTLLSSSPFPPASGQPPAPLNP